MLTRQTLARINDRTGKVNPTPLLAVGGGAVVLTVLLYMWLTSLMFALVVLLVGILFTLALYRAHISKSTVSLSYKGNLSDEVSSRFSEVREALKTLSSSEKVWRLADAAKLPEAEE